MTPMVFVLIISAAVLAFAVISAAVTNAPRLGTASSMVPVRPTTTRMTRGSEAGFGAGVKRR